jgi:hypothetical protein
MRAAYFRVLTALLATCLPAQRSAADAPARARTKLITRSARETSVSAASDAGKPTLYLEVWPTVHARTEKARGPFVPDISLHPGDAIELMVRTSSEAQVYLLHCDARATLSIFPDAGGIPFHADQWVTLPASGMPIVLGETPGAEALYVVSTRDPLERSDPKLARHLRGAASASGSTCDDKLEALLAGNVEPPQPSGSTPFTVKPPAHKSRYALRGIDLSKPTSPVARAFADHDGIVVLRLAYQNKP